ncbi:Amino acid transporter, permease [Rhodopirellula islandica]|uniref:Amino acid transporter, permease n=1 Tax=Rhodopirellula islandica TaxID=595434 RepID=A0A0J1B3K2_RHOIS|nr:amino acid permease [Rhodopirellula islandica]KLU01410.1 Amino acid transporter, permease [Rhodopirellula islandica]
MTADLQSSRTPEPAQLRRDVGLFGAMMMGLGSIIGTGVFVSIGIAAGITGPSVVFAILVAALVAAFNGLSSAQLAAVHPVSGGTYEYGYRWLTPSLGFTAGWMFLCAKSASAATAALGLAGYALQLLEIDRVGWVVPVAVGAVLATTLLLLGGIRRSNWTNIAIVSTTLIALASFVIAGLPVAWREGFANMTPLFTSDHPATATRQFLEACALMFVAYTGYGRIATLGEEVQTPHRTIPRAIIATLLVSSLLYAIVGGVAVAAVGTGTLSSTSQPTSPLQLVANQLNSPLVAKLVSIGAVTAMLGVLLNLILGLSRVVFAMGRRGDLPGGLATVSNQSSTPYVAVIAVGMGVGSLALIGDVKTTWSFSAFTVLVYYALTNLAATRLTVNERLFPPIVPWLGLASCLGLAFWVQPKIWIIGLALVAIGLVFQRWMQQRSELAD